MITVNGIVLKERIVGEQDKFIDILTNEYGIMEISVKGARKINGKSASSAQLFAYSRFCINQKGSRFFLNSAEPIHIFYDLRKSLSRISLASYFSDVLRYCITSENQNNDIMRLLLNCLYFLESGKRSEEFLKAVFEFRLMSEIGYMPDVVGCRECGVYEPQTLFFSISDGGFYCEDCFDNDSDINYIKVKISVLNSIRHIVLADFSRLFNFRTSDDTMHTLSALSESYFLSHLGRDFQTLDFYKTIKV